ncbi:MAG: GNAT family N-acetyltransferase [Xanthomonadales bacterium]|nr:GNAT family N-acetyltransferase [Xanthomonadales bacterium]
MSFRIEILSDAHPRGDFLCGAPALERYLQQQAGQDMRRRLAYCFVVLTDSGGLAGYYTLAATSIPLDGLVAAQTRRLPRYPSIPAALLGRLAVSVAHQGFGLGAALLFDALQRAARSEVVAHLLVVDAGDEAAAGFYRHHGFEALPDVPLRLIRRI